MVARENRKIALIRPMFQGDEEPEDLPEWARLTPAEKARLPLRPETLAGRRVIRQDPSPMPVNRPAEDVFYLPDVDEQQEAV